MSRFRRPRAAKSRHTGACERGERWCGQLGSLYMYGTVIETQRLSPTMVRVILGGEGLEGYTPAPHTDQYVNALFIPDGAPYAVPFDLDAARAEAAEHRPRGRRYTIRWWDPDARRLAIDFVVHGDVGYAGRWAVHATAGDRLQMLGPSGGYSPDVDADWYLLAGDESAIPAIARSLEALPAGATAIGEYFEAATAMFLFAVSLWLESYGTDRARSAVRSFSSPVAGRLAVGSGQPDRVQCDCDSAV